MNEVLNTLNAVILALNTVDTHGEQSLLNLGGAIHTLREIQGQLAKISQSEDIESVD